MLDEIIAAIIIFAVLIGVIVALVMLATAVVLLLACAGAAWVAWRFLPFRTRLADRRSPIDRLTDMYVAGHMDIVEFERRVATALRGVARFP
jgi:hypothetical protein